MDKGAATTPTKSTTDDESINTSTESETFETWTLVTDKKQRVIAPALDSDLQETANNRVEIIKQDKSTFEEDEEAETHKLKNEHDSTADEFSDGISIISESESAGRISPHPYLREHLNSLNLKFSTGDDYEFPTSIAENLIETAEAATEGKQLRQRRRKRSTSTNSEKRALERTNTAIVDTTSERLLPIVRRGLAGVFYVGVALALLAFIGKLRYPEWQPLGDKGKPITELEQKLSELELQNNLMRAEIDIISKQVHYLGTQGNIESSSPYTRPHQHPKSTAADWDKKTERQAKTFKAWSGNGNIMDPVEITKGDLKRPHKCPDGKFVEIAGMCVEKRPAHEEPLIDQFGNAVDDILQQSETYKSFEKLAEQLNAFTENPFEPDGVGGDLENTPTEQTLRAEEVKINPPPNESGAREEKSAQSYKHSAERHVKYDNDFHSKERMRHTNKYEKRKPQEQHRTKFNIPDVNDDDDDDDDDSVERFSKRARNSKERFDNSKSHRGNSEERHDHFKERHDHSKERHDNSKERHDHSKERHDNNHSKERLHKHDNNSKERFRSGSGKHERSRKGSEEQDFYKHAHKHQDGHWQQKLMKHREEARQENERQRNDKNWYIERGSSREQIRNR